MPASETPKIRQTNGGGNRICVEHEPTTCNAPRRCQEPTFAGCKTNRRSQARTAYASQDFGSSLVTYRSVAFDMCIAIQRAGTKPIAGSPETNSGVAKWAEKFTLHNLGQECTARGENRALIEGSI